MHQLDGQGVQPALELAALAPTQRLVQLPLHQPRRPGHVAGGQGVVDGLVGQPLGPVPGGRGPVQLGHPLGPLLGQADTQQVGEQVVVAPPAPHLVQRHQEQVGPLDPLQQPLAVGPPRHRVTQGTAQPLQHRGLQ
jgi:hypothetical protein